MQLRRFVGIVDIGILAVILVAILLPAREVKVSAAVKGGEADRFALALAEARTLARPDDGAAIAALAQRLGAAGFKDWAIEAAVRGGERMKQSPTRWRALLAASVAFADRVDVVPALDYANRALAACDDQFAACPSWEQVRMRIYQQHLDAGVKSGIDPRRDPDGFRRAGESGLRQVHVGGRTGERSDVAPAPAPAGSGSTTP
jgi:hypothetical protein